MLSISNRSVPPGAVSAPSPAPIEKKLLDEVETTRALCRTAKSYFVDLLNPLEMSAYHWESAFGDKLGCGAIEGMLPGFLRPNRAAKALAIFPPNGPIAADVCQGELGDCWFLCVVAVLAEVQPNLIRSLFLLKEVNPEGVFGLKLWKDGNWTAVLIDATFPTVFGGTRLKFAHCQRATDLWVPLLEKAYAKICGGYQNIESGRPIDAFYDLTGMPCVELRNGGSGFGDARWSQDELVAQLASYSSANCVITASCGGTASTEKAGQALGLVTNHAYSVLRVDVDPKTREPIVVVRNPWGQSTQGFARRGDNGIAHLSFAQFASAFSSVTICITRNFATAVCIPNVRCSATAMFSVENPHQLSFIVRDTAEVYVLAAQLDARRTGNKYFDVMIMIAKFTANGTKVVASCKSSCERVTMVYAMLDTGRYCIIPLSMKGDGSALNVTLLSESATVSVVSDREGMSGGYPMPHVPSLLHEAATRFGGVSRRGQGFMDVVVVTLGTLHALFVTNKDRTFITATVNASQSHGMFIVGNGGPSPFSTATVPPGKTCLVLMANVLPNSGGYSCAFGWEYTAVIGKGNGVTPTGLFAPF
jgi:hypothetical protein